MNLLFSVAPIVLWGGVVLGHCFVMQYSVLSSFVIIYSC